MMFRKACQLKEVICVNFLLETQSASYTFFSFCKQNDVISQSYKIADNSRMKQGILYLSKVLLIFVNKNFRFRSPLK